MGLAIQVACSPFLVRNDQLKSWGLVVYKMRLQQWWARRVQAIKNGCPECPASAHNIIRWWDQTGRPAASTSRGHWHDKPLHEPRPAQPMMASTPARIEPGGSCLLGAYYVGAWGILPGCVIWSPQPAGARIRRVRERRARDVSAGSTIGLHGCFTCSRRRGRPHK